MAKESPQTEMNTYSQSEIKATPAFAVSGSGKLKAKILGIIAQKGAISFRDYMELALYHPEYGYYASGAQRVGKQGDFITSVSVGCCFGIILARRIISFWKEMGSPELFHIIEPGANDGGLCSDILDEIQRCEPHLYSIVQYHLIETTQVLRDRQVDKLSVSHLENFTSHPDFSAVKGLTGVLLSNELPDAFPVELVRYTAGGWKPLNVTQNDGELEFVTGDFASNGLETFCESLDIDFPEGHFSEGYTTEYSPHLGSFAEDASRSLAKGLFITIDYGHEHQDIYHPQRIMGTLQTYYQHQKADKPLLNPGEQDITSHVNFTELIRAAENTGFRLNSLTMQSSYLTRHAREWLMSMEGSAEKETVSLLRQFQTLTHPSMLGTKFMVLEMVK